MMQEGENDASGLFRRSAVSGATTRWSEYLPAFLAAVAVQETAALTASAIAEGLVATMGARCAALHFADGDERTLRLVASCNMPEACSELHVFDRDGLEPAACAARSRLLFLDKEQRDGALFALPLLSGTRLLGAVTFELPVRVESRELASLEALGVVFGALVDRARREDEARARADWTSLVAHELRQPLNALTMHASVLGTDVENGRVKSSVRRIGDSVQRLNRLIGDLSDTSLVDLGMVRLTRTPTDVVSLVASLADGCGQPTGSVEVAVRGEIPTVDVDPHRMRQVLSNLLDNARKYAPAGSVVRVLVERRVSELVVSVTNEGPCIDERRLARLFDRYYRGDYSRIDGLGIGLYVSRGLAEAHGGTISVSSGAGTTTFSLVLPLARISTRPSVAGCPAIPRAAAANAT
jgi:signal transduction histidine kinase